MSTNWYKTYCKEHGIQQKHGKRALQHEYTLRRRVSRAAKLEDEDLSSFATREEAQEHLEKRASEMGLTGTIVFQIVMWVIKMLLDRHFRDNNS